MLIQLTIDNYALIDKSVIEFVPGFTVITGETGAGKSIMLDALGLLMGVRADSKALGSKERKTIVEGLFEKPDLSLKPILEQQGIDWDDKVLILRREISLAGKSRGFVNDTPVNLTTLQEVSQHLIDIHSQHGNSVLTKPTEQLSIIDSFGNLQSLVEDYRNTFRQYVDQRNRIKQIKESIEKGKENKDFIIFRLEQLDKLKPKEGELESLEREADILGDADRIKNDLSEAVRLLGDGNVSVIKTVNSAAMIVEGLDLTLFDPHGNDQIRERLENLKIELRDITDTLEAYSEKIIDDPARLEKVQSRIESIYEIMKRMKVSDEKELVALHQSLKQELKTITGDDTDISAMEIKLKESAKTLKEKAELLTTARGKAAQEFAETLMERIRPLGLPNIKFEVSMEKGKLTSDGQDQISFLCSFNKNHPIQALSEIASGGEIARVMLGIKSVMSDKMGLPTMIFDEIDTGVSGEIAHKMGSMMQDMSKSKQVMAVTHLPQVAARGTQHLKVYKKDDKDKTVSHIRKLSSEERVEEIAGMMSGTSINAAAVENARILLNQN